MPIEANVTGQQQITASVSETQIDVSVGGGVGPTGPAGTTSWTGIVDKPSSFNPSPHAATHAVGGVDYIAPAAIGAATQVAAESLQLQVDGKAASSHTHPASAITSGTINSSRLPLATVSAPGAIVVGAGLGVSSGVTSVSWGSSSTTSCRGDDARLSDSREWSAATVTQAEAESGTDIDRKAFTPLRVFQAIAAWWNGSAAKTKLDGIATGATANATDSQLRDRSTHTGTQTASTISDFTTAVIAAAPPTTNASLLTSGTISADRIPNTIARTSDVTSAVAAVVGAAPASLDTLQELSAALANDANFASTVTNSLAAKAPLASPTFTGTVSGITKAMVGLGNVQNVDATDRSNHTGTQSLSTISDAGTAASKNVPATGNASSTQVVLGSDTRLTDSRTPANGSVTAASLAAGQDFAVRSLTATVGVIVDDGTNQWSASAGNFRLDVGGVLRYRINSSGAVVAGVWQGTAIAVAYGGTGATTASGARANLGLGSLATQSTVAWSTDITGIPSTFTPSSHTHGTSDITGLDAALQGIDSAISGKAAATHASHHAADGSDEVFGLLSRWHGKYSQAYSENTGYPLNAIVEHDGALYRHDADGPDVNYPGDATWPLLAGHGIATASHKTTHAIGGSDALSPSDIGAAAASHAHSATADLTFAGATAGQVLTVNSGATALVWATPTTYSLPDATNSVKGGVIVGSGLSVSSGTISVITYAVLSDTVSSTSYIGRAASGSATSASVWTIRRTVLTSAGAVSATTTATNVKWDDRLTASYS